MKTSYEDQYFLLRKALGTEEFGPEAAVADIEQLKADLAAANNDLMAIACLSNDVRLTDRGRLNAIVRILVEEKTDE